MAEPVLNGRVAATSSCPTVLGAGGLAERVLAWLAPGLALRGVRLCPDAFGRPLARGLRPVAGSWETREPAPIGRPCPSMRPAAAPWGGPDVTISHVSVADLPKHERSAYIKEVMSANVLPLEVRHHDEDVALSLRCMDLTDVSLHSMSASDTTFRRTARQARDDAPSTVYLALQRTGASRVSQDGRQAIIRPGELVLTRSPAPATVAMTGGSSDLYLVIPAGQLALPERTVAGLTAVRLGPERPLVRIVASHLEQLATARPLASEEALALVRPTIGLVRALVAINAQEPGLAGGPMS